MDDKANFFQRGDVDRYDIWPSRTSVRIFNGLCDVIMPEVFQLQKSNQKIDHAHAVDIANALYRLYCAIMIHHQLPDWASFRGKEDGKLDEHQVNKCFNDFARRNSVINYEVFRSCSFNVYQQAHQRFERSLSLDEALLNGHAYGKTPIFCKVEQALQHRPLQVSDDLTLYSGVLCSIRRVKRLWAFVEQGNLPAIVDMDCNADEIELLLQSNSMQKAIANPLYALAQLISGQYSPMEQFIAGQQMTANTLLGGPIPKYNALMLAIIYRHATIVRYFVNEKKADLTRKCGDITTKYCAEHRMLPRHRDLENYVKHHYSMNESRPRFFKPPLKNYDADEACQSQKKNTKCPGSSQAIF